MTDSQTSQRDIAKKLCQLAMAAPTRAAWRQAAVQELRGELRFDAALFHELSPRVSLEYAGHVGLELERVESTRGSWDSNAVELGRLQIRALAQGGVATDREAFASSRRARTIWRQRVLEPLGLRSVLVAHLLLDERIISVLLLGRRSGPAFTTAERKALTPLLPVLTVCDALHLPRLGQVVPGAPTTVRCLDQRLTPRQREIVEHVALGRTNADIGLALGVSPHTVRNLLVEVRRRLGAANRAEIVRVAVTR